MGAITTNRIEDSPYFKDRTGKRYGHLVAIKPLKRQNRCVVWLCRCDCGKTKEILSNRLLHNQKSCGCLTHRKGTESPLWHGYGGISGHRWSKMIRGAKKRNLPFNISIEDAWHLYTGQDGKCALSGCAISFESKTASLDRIDNLKGYVLGNIQWVHTDLNKMKWVLSEHRFFELCSLVSKPMIPDGSHVSENVHNRKWNGVGNVPNWLIGRLRDVAKGWKSERRASFDDEIDAGFLWNLYVRQNGACALTGIPLFFPKNAYVRKDGNVSLDRIDSTLGYTPDNVQWVDKTVNLMKRDMCEDKFKKWCFLVSAYEKNKPSVQWAGVSA